MHPREEKSLLRLSIKERLSRMTDKQRQAESRSVCRRIVEALPKDPIPVGAYFPLKDEVDVRPLLHHLLEQNYPLFLPKTEQGKIVYRRVKDLQDLTDGTYGIPEPPTTAEPMDETKPFIALVPGRAFTKDGKRVGRGNGGYDIWIRGMRAANPLAKFWGIALECQLINDIPMEEQDEKVDAVLTARDFSSRGCIEGNG